MSEKIMLLEDDENLGLSLRKFIQDEGYQVDLARNLEEARTKKIEDYDLMILDWMLPDGQGVDYLKEVRSKTHAVPIIMLTARTELIDKVIGLESGANDYVTKPFEPRELVARIRAQLRLSSASGGEKESDGKVEIGDLMIDKHQREVFFGGKPVEMTKMEFDFLKLLAEHPNRAFSRDEILNKVWGYEHYPTTRTVDTHVLQLRQKTRDDLIETVRGVGYRLRFNG
tara:strand:- start:15463 stop:16143 length:681 start_codon:yes stop_codon:yes gene_type:complete